MLDALRPVTLVVGHYGVGKTNFSVNLALDLASAGRRVSIIDLDIVNPYFRASEQRRVLEDYGVELIAPVFVGAITAGLDIDSEINVETSGGVVNQSGIVAFMADSWAIMHTIRKQRIGEQYFSIEDVHHYEYQFVDAYMNNLNMPAVVFTLQDYTQP